MASIQQVYNTLRDLTNKEQKGFITPKVFNSLAFVAQMNVYNEFFTELVDAKRLSRQGFELGRDKSLKKQKLEDLSYFVKKTAIDSSGNVFAKPWDLSKIISINIYDAIESGVVTSGTVRNSCEILYDIEKANYILGSNLSTPTRDFPVALVAENIEVFPASVNRIELTYYKAPTSWKWGTKEVGPQDPNYSVNVQVTGLEVPDPTFMRDFMLPDHCVPELVSEMAKLLGVRLRDPNVLAFASREEATE
tara:strand:+ start:422 stop:1168 length:747 start_codon:yes stop_codon:yes gene_type:complete